MIMSDNVPSSMQSQGGMVLIEVLVSILIFAIGILAVIGLQAAAIANVTDSRYRTEASALANQHLARMWVDQSNFASYVGTVSVPELPNGSMTTTMTNTSTGTDVNVVVTWQPPNATAAHNFDTVTRIYAN